MRLPLKLELFDRGDGVIQGTLSAEGADSDTFAIPFESLVNGTATTVLLEFPEQKSPGARPPSERLRKRARKSELVIAEDIGGKAQKNSGALPWAKGDVRLRGKHRIESKTTQTKSYHVTRRELDKIRSECSFGEKPAFVIVFINPSTFREDDKWVLQPYADWHEANVDSRSSGSGSSDT